MSTETPTGQEPDTATPPAVPEPAPASVPEAPADTPPWDREGVPFDADRAWNLIQNLRGDLAAAKSRTATPEPDAAPADLDTKVARLESQLARERVARKHQLPEDLLDLLGDGDEATLTARAEALLAWRTGGQAPTAEPLAHRPTENLHGGATPDAMPDETDPAKLADRVRSRRPF